MIVNIARVAIHGLKRHDCEREPFVNIHTGVLQVEEIDGARFFYPLRQVQYWYILPEQQIAPATGETQRLIPPHLQDAYTRGDLCTNCLTLLGEGEGYDGLCPRCHELFYGVTDG